jgi:hypothetical protein
VSATISPLALPLFRERSTVSTKITITLDPENYDLLRETIKQERDEQNAIAKREGVNAPDRAEARQLTMRLQQLLNQL